MKKGPLSIVSPVPKVKVSRHNPQGELVACDLRELIVHPQCDLDLEMVQIAFRSTTAEVAIRHADGWVTVYQRVEP